MKKNLRFLLALLFVLAAFVAVPAVVSADDGGTTGTCTWTYTESNHTLSISADGGTGTMGSYVPKPTYDNSAPWQQYCQLIESIYISPGVENIGAYAFSSCTVARNVYVYEPLAIIGDHAFEYCTSLSYISIPKSVVQVGKSAFLGCYSLENVYFAEGELREIGEDAFLNADSLQSVRLPISILTIGSHAFGYWTEDGYDRNPEFSRIIGYAGAAKNYANANGITFEELPTGGKTGGCTWRYDSGSRILYISGNGYMDNYNYAPSDGAQCDAPWAFLYGIAARVVVEEGVRSIGEYAFSHFYQLLDITLPSTLRMIGEGAFQYCGRVQRININGDDCEIKSRAFFHSGAETDVYGDPLQVYCMGVKSIELQAFAECPMAYLSLSPKEGSELTIGTEAFLGCECLTEVAPLDGCRAIKDGAFEDCYVLATLTLSEGLKTIGNKAFLNTSLKSVYIPGSVTSIGSYAFGYNFMEGDLEDLMEKVAGFTIVASCKNTVAVNYAKNNGFTFKSDGLHKISSTVTRKATPTQDGIIRKVCKVCGKKGSATAIPKVSKISLAWTSAVYTGKVLAPKVIVRNRNNTEIPSSNYTLTFTNAKSKAVGEYKVKVTLKGTRYSGSKTMTYTIVPGKVKGVQRTRTTGTAIYLAWDQVKGAQKYVIFARQNGKTIKKVTVEGQTAGTVTGLKAGTQYSFLMRAYANGIGGGLSDEKYYWTKPNAPKIKYVGSGGKQELLVEWSKVAGAAYYQVYVRALGTKKWVLLATTKATDGTLRRFDGVKPAGQVFYVKVRAVTKDRVYSSFSKEDWTYVNLV